MVTQVQIVRLVLRDTHNMAYKTVILVLAILQIAKIALIPHQRLLHVLNAIMATT
jgi:hypothetical protein